MINDWRVELGKIVDGRSKATRAEIETARFAEFVNTVVKPALEELAQELNQHERTSIVRITSASATITVSSGDTEEISFRILSRSLPAGSVPYAEIRLHKGQRLVKSEAAFKSVNATFTIDQVKASDIISCFLSYYRTALDRG